MAAVTVWNWTGKLPPRGDTSRKIVRWVAMNMSAERASDLRLSDAGVGAGDEKSAHVVREMASYNASPINCAAGRVSQ